MSLTLRFSLDETGVRPQLRAARERGQDLRPAWRAVGRAGVAQTRRRFLNGVGPDGSPWKKGRKPSGQTLIDQGLLLRSISARNATQDGVEWGSNRVYAAIHQTGGVIRPVRAGMLRFKVAGGFISAKKVRIPARPYLGVNAENMTAFSQILLRHVGGPLTGAA